MKFSVIIPTVDNVQDLIECTESIVSCSNLDDLELIVVDNGSTDNTPKFLEYLAENKTVKNLKVITNEDNKGFCTATNQGMAASTGKYIVWLNDDTVVCENWLERMLRGITTPNFHHDNVGLVGPLSNNAAGMQSHQSLQEATIKDIPKVIADLDRETRRLQAEKGQQNDGSVWNVDYSMVGFLSGFCLMMTRAVYEKIGGIDERFSPGGFCDNDFVHRATEAGFASVISPTCFIYHKGHKTLDKLFPELSRGVANWATYVNKYIEKDTKTLLLTQRVKIDDEEQLQLFRDCAARNLPLVDGVIILSDRSKLLTYEIAKEMFGDKLRQFIPVKKSAGFSETRDRLNLLQAAYDADFDWCIMMDHDECFSEGAKAERVQTLMHPLDPNILCYEMYFNNFWRSKELARTDGNWGTMFMRRMWKNVFKPKLRPKMSVDDPGLHTGGIPISIPMSCSMPCNLSVDHYGYIDFERTKEKKEWYEKIDTTPDSIKQSLVGDNGYDHLTNESGLTMMAPKPWTLSVNTMMLNEEMNIGLMLMQYFAIVDEFILIDTGSTDNTMKNLDMVGVPYTKMDLNKNFSAVRNRCIELSTSKYCMHIDPDERLEEGGLHKIIAMLPKGPEVAVWRLENVQKTGHRVTTFQPRIFKNSPKYFYSGRVHETLDKALLPYPKIHSEDYNIKSVNTGFLEPDEKIHKKLAVYAELLELELVDNPDNSKAMFELALHYRNYGNLPRAEELLRTAVSVNPDLIAAWRELSLMKITEAFEIIKCTDGMHADADMLNSVREIYTKLQPLAAAHVKVGNPGSVV